MLPESSLGGVSSSSSDPSFPTFDPLICSHVTFRSAAGRFAVSGTLGGVGAEAIQGLALVGERCWERRPAEKPNNSQHHTGIDPPKINPPSLRRNSTVLSYLGKSMEKLKYWQLLLQ